MRAVRIFMLCACALVLGFAADAQAEEQRCTELGANCVCSEPLNTNVYAHPDSVNYNPADSVTKQCSAELTNHPIARKPGVNDVFGSNDPTVLSKLPPGHSVNYFMRAGNNHTNIFWMGEQVGSKFDKRLAMRWYWYHSPNFQFWPQGGCTNHKRAYLENSAGNDGLIITAGSDGDGINAYNFSSWNIGLDCCGTGKGPHHGDSGPRGNEWKDRWWMFELVVSNRSGGTGANRTRVQVFARDLTTNGPERLILDTDGTIGEGAGGQWQGPYSTLSPARRIGDRMLADLYRQDQCNGYYGFTHFMVAGWDTNQGQRIGPAAEVEGGSGDTTPPAAPTNLRIQ